MLVRNCSIRDPRLQTIRKNPGKKRGTSGKLKEGPRENNLIIQRMTKKRGKKKTLSDRRKKSHDVSPKELRGERKNFFAFLNPVSLIEVVRNWRRENLTKKGNR